MNVLARNLFFSFVGRINRATYWTRAFPLFLIWGLIVNAILAFEYETTGSQGVVSFALSLAGFWPVLAVTIKRLHDRGRSAWFLFIIFVPVLGAIWLLAEVWFLPGTDRANRYGEIPRDKGLNRRWVVPFGVAGATAQAILIAWTSFWPGAELRHALIANEFELIRLATPVSGSVALPSGNSLILMQVDGNARIDDIEISQCTFTELYPTEAQACRLDVSKLERSHDLIIHVGTLFATPAFSLQKADGRVVVILSVDYLGTDPPNADVGWVIDEISRQYWGR